MTVGGTKRYNNPVFHKKIRLEKSPKKYMQIFNLQSKTLFLLLSPLIIPWPLRFILHLCGTQSVVKTLSSSSSYNSKMLVMHWSININDLIMQYIIILVKGPFFCMLQKTIKYFPPQYWALRIKTKHSCNIKCYNKMMIMIIVINIDSF